jgi:uncharacterized protein (TIGR00369 family)
MTDATKSIPHGFEPHFRQSPVTDPWEPLFSYRHGELFCIGLHIDDRHCNARGHLHGGVISTLSDNALGLCCVLQIPNTSAITVNLSVDFLAVGQKGQWLEVRARPTKLGRTLAFSEAQIFAGDKIIGRANATFRMIDRA